MTNRIYLCFWVLVLAIGTAGSLAFAQPTSSWSEPSDITVKRAGGLPSVQDAYYFFDNMDCTLLTYRKADADSMSSGCFSRFSLGMMDISDQLVIYNGSDEAYPLIPPGSGQTLLPWPGSGRLVSISNMATGGARLGVYLNPLAQLRDNRPGLILVSKFLLTGPDKKFSDNSGATIDINPVTLAFSRNGEWLVAETLSGSFVRINRDGLGMLPFAPSYGMTNIDHLSDTRVAISDDGRYVALSSRENNQFRVYDLGNCGGALNDYMSLPARRCNFYDYWPSVKSRLDDSAVIRHVRFLHDELVSFEVIYDKEPSQTGIYTLSPDGQFSDRIDYLALGDSYTSGEGAFDYLAGTDTESNKCHLSVWSYPLRLSAGGHSVACSGAIIKDVGSTDSQYRGQVKGAAPTGSLSGAFVEDSLTNYTPGYLPQHYFAARYQPRTMTVSIGGNDIGFGNILKHCVMIHLSLNNTCYSNYEDRLERLELIDRKVSALIDLFRQLQSEAPGLRLYVIGYPEVADPDGNCANNVHLNRSELEFSEQIIRYLDASIHYAAGQAGADYIDISKALYGHRLCETSSDQIAVNGLTAGNDAGPIGHESYHPNALGHALIAQSIREQTADFSLWSAAVSPSPPDNAGILQSVTKTGRQMYAVDAAQNMATLRGARLDIRLVGAETGLRPNASYSIALDGPDGRLLASALTDEWGDMNVSLGLPADVTGDHFIDVSGPGQGDQLLDISQSIYVSDPPANSNGISVKIGNLYVSG